MKFTRTIKLRRDITNTYLDTIKMRFNRIIKTLNVHEIMYPCLHSINDGYNRISEGKLVEITVECESKEIANEVFKATIEDCGEIEDIRLNQLITAINNSGKSNKEMLEEIKMLKGAVYVLLDAAKAQQSTNRVVLAMADALVDNKNGISRITMTAEEAIANFENRNKQR